MNIKSTQGSDVQKVDDEGEILIVVVKPLMSLTLSWNGLRQTQSRRKIPMYTRSKMKGRC